MHKIRLILLFLLIPILCFAANDMTITSGGAGTVTVSGSGAGVSGDSITVNSSAATDPDFLNGDIDWTLSGGTSITATIGCSGCVDDTDLAADSVSSSELNATGVEAELEAVLDLQDLQGAVTDGQVPNTITVDLATAATALAADGANCSAGNYPLGVDASGAVQSCTAVGAGSGDITDVGNITTGAAFTQSAGNDGNSLWFEGSTSDTNEILLTGGNPASDVTITIPARTGTLITDADTGTVTSSMVLDATLTTSDMANTLTFGSNAYINLSAVGSNSLQGLRIPQAASCASSTGLGQLCANTTTGVLGMGTGSAIAAIGGGVKCFPLLVQSAKITGAYVTATISGLDTATQGAQIDGGDGNWRLLYDPITDEGAVWQFMIPQDYRLFNSIKMVVSANSATSGKIEMEGAVSCITPGASADINTPAFGAGATDGGITVPGTAGFPYATSVAPTVTCLAGDVGFIYVSTDANDGTNDNATGDRELITADFCYQP